MQQPAPFEIVRDTARVLASDGCTSVIVHGAELAAQAEVVRSRAISGLRAKPVAEQLIPMLNEFATRLLNDSTIDDKAAAQTLRSFADMVKLPPPQHHEALCVRVRGVEVRVSQGLVVVQASQQG